MDNNALVTAVEEEIATLQQVRSLLAGVDGTASRRGRPAASSFAFGANTPRKTRVMSAAAKAKIRAAQKKRWAEWHKTHPKK